jgi:hypothetical protein
MAKTKASKGQGSSGRRSEKRTKRFAPAGGGGGAGARANVLRDGAPASAGAKRPLGGEGGASPAAKKYKQGTFARPAAAGKAGGGAAAARAPQAAPLSRKELAAEVEARKAVRKPNAALIQARPARDGRREAATARQPPRRRRALCRAAGSPAPARALAGADGRVGEAAAPERHAGGAHAAHGARFAAHRVILASF